MIITCPACATRYDLPEGAIGPEGRTVRCANCRESWFEPGPEPEEPAAQPASDVPADEPSAAIPPEPAAAEPEPPAPPPPPPVFDRLPLVAPTPTAPGTGAEQLAPAPEPSPAIEKQSRFRAPRRWKAWLLALLAFGLLVGAIGAALMLTGTPDWLPFGQTRVAASKPGLVLDFPRDRIERKTLADGTEFFGARGTITNVGAARQSVPPLLIVLRDSQRREVYRWEVVPPKRQLAPGETMTINEAVTDIPKSAVLPEIGWKAG